MSESTLTRDALDALQEVFNHTDIQPETVQILFDHAQVTDYEAGTVLCREGRIEHTLYILLNGHVDISRTYGGAEQFIDTLKPGACFGELALIMNVPRTAQVTATDTVRVIELHREDFNRFIKSEPNALLAIVQLVIQRMLDQDNRRLVQQARRSKYDNAAQKVFISYARSDEAFVRRMDADLKKHGINTWVDFDDIVAGKSWARQIGEALDSCDIMLLVFSPTAMESTNVEDEWNYYLDRGKMIIPVLYQPCTIPYRLYKLQYVDFNDRDYADAVADLVDTLRIHIGDY